MRYTGTAYDLSGGEVFVSPVTDAVLTRNRISIDWDESGDRGHLQAELTEQTHFRGDYTYIAPDLGGTFDLRRYTSGDGVILFGTWKNTQQGWDGLWLFVLWPTEAQ